jgi:hypothetical protein
MAIRRFRVTAPLPKIEELPRKKSTDVKNRWGDLLRQVREQGTVAITAHDKVELVVIEAKRYAEAAALLGSVEARREKELAELTAEFDHHLARLREAGSRERLDAALEARGRATPRPKAGPSY